MILVSETASGVCLIDRTQRVKERDQHVHDCSPSGSVFIVKEGGAVKFWGGSARLVAEPPRGRGSRGGGTPELRGGA